MQKKSPIKQNILKHLDFIGVSKYEFYKKTNITRGILDQDNGISEENIAKYLAYFKEINPEWLLTGNGKMLKGEKEVVNIKNDKEPIIHLIPLYDGVMTASMIAQDLPTQTESVEMVNAGDWFRDATAAMRVHGDSMYPNYVSGSIVAMKEVFNKRLIIPGQDYMIETSEYRVLKRLQRSEDKQCYLACSTNLEIWEVGPQKGKLIHEPFDIHLDDMVRLYQILGSVKRNHSSRVVTIE